MLYTLRATQFFKEDPETLWKFISLPENLEKITPDSMSFKIKENYRPGPMYAGQIIEYSLKPLAGIRVNWVTEITHVKDQESFVDEQRFGPYAFWHHRHVLRRLSNGVEMEDVVHYRLPFGFIGRIAHRLFVRKKLENIFEFRRVMLDRLFNYR